MNRIIMLLAVITIISCNSKTDIRREVFAGWELGSSIVEVNEKGEDMMKSGRIIFLKPGINYVPSKALGKYYYSSPIFMFHDTILSQIKVVSYPSWIKLKRI
ncbi:MAG: hypothetical protein IPP96_09495 [Chitinophagaceae bacterium]|nr:hypothetical protein [Chitinophagaceae bacterium]